MYHHEDHDCYVTNKIYHFYLNGFVTNLSLKTKDEGSVDCHKVVLIAMSKYLRLMFDVGSADVDINVLELNTTSDIVKYVLQFIYNGTTDIHENNVEMLLAQSINMQLHQLTLQCKNFIEKNLSIDNVVRYHECSMSLQFEPLSIITSVYIKNNCRQLLSTGNLTKLRIDNLKSLLSYMNTNGTEEQIKLDIILQWLTFHSDCNESAKLLNAIQFDELPIKCLKCIKNNPLLEGQHAIVIQESLNMKYEQELEKQRAEIEEKQKMLEKQHVYQEKKKEQELLLKQQQNVKKEQKKINEQHGTMKKQLSWVLPHQQQIKVIAIPVIIAIVISITISILPTKPQINRQQPTSEEYLVMMTQSLQISIYNESTNNWIALMRVPDWVDGSTSWYASEHRIIVAGAYYNSATGDRVAVLDMKSLGVEELPRLPVGRCWTGVVVDGDEVYIIGGENSSRSATNTVYSTNITQNNGWTTLPTLPYATSGSLISVDSDYIYVFGGFPYGILTQIYNKHTQQWSRGATIPAACDRYTGQCEKKGNTFTIITRNTMMEYNSNDDTWKVVKQYKAYENTLAAAVSYKGDILSYGIHKANEISRYDADSDDAWVKTSIDLNNIAHTCYLFKVNI